MPKNLFKGTNVAAASTWENMVASCDICNRFKGSRTPEQARMKLLSKPTKMDHAQLLRSIHHSSDTPEEWSVYLAQG